MANRFAHSTTGMANSSVVVSGSDISPLCCLAVTRVVIADVSLQIGFPVLDHGHPSALPGLSQDLGDERGFQLGVALRVAVGEDHVVAFERRVTLDEIRTLDERVAQ